jgi:heat-inducible transcriptional repressor
MGIEVHSPSDMQPEIALTPRQREILRMLVQEYIDTAQPIGSSTLRGLGTLQVSSATIRSELGLLEELGFLAQPHTSAGRVPTARGYRLFVEQLMEQSELPAPERRTIRHQFHQMRLNLDQWMRLTAAILAHSTLAASLVTPPHAIRARFRHLELISTNDTTCLMIMVLQDSSIHQEMLVMSNPIEQDALSKTSHKFSELLRNRSVSDIEGSTHPELTDLTGWEQQILDHIMGIMKQGERRSVSEVYRDGMVNIYRQPEYEDADRFRQLLELLERRSLLEAILARTLNASGIQVIIGGEGPFEAMDDLSLVLSPYGLRGKASGVLGIMGPTRMSYARAVSTVRYVAQLMDDLIADLYGH